MKGVRGLNKNTLALMLAGLLLLFLVAPSGIQLWTISGTSFPKEPTLAIFYFYNALGNYEVMADGLAAFKQYAPRSQELAITGLNSLPVFEGYTWRKGNIGQFIVSTPLPTLGTTTNNLSFDWSAFGDELSRNTDFRDLYGRNTVTIIVLQPTTTPVTSWAVYYDLPWKTVETTLGFVIGGGSPMVLAMIALYREQDRSSINKSPYIIEHEVMHMFGATDLYLQDPVPPEEIDSLMHNSRTLRLAPRTVTEFSISKFRKWGFETLIVPPPTTFSSGYGTRLGNLMGSLQVNGETLTSSTQTVTTSNPVVFTFIRSDNDSRVADKDLTSRVYWKGPETDFKPLPLVDATGRKWEASHFFTEGKYDIRVMISSQFEFIEYNIMGQFEKPSGVTYTQNPLSSLAPLFFIGIVALLFLLRRYKS